MKCYKTSLDYLNKLPKRKYYYLFDPIMGQMNNIGRYLGELMDRGYEGGINKLSLQDAHRFIIDEILKLQPKLLALWNIQDYEEHAMCVWCDSFNEVISVLSVLANVELTPEDEVYILDKYHVTNSVAVKNILELQKYIYSKVITAPRSYRNSSGEFLVDNIDRAVYMIAQGSFFKPESKDDYAKRVECYSEALNLLKQMNQPIMTYVNVMGSSERVITDLASLYAASIKTLKNLISYNKKKM